MRVRGHSLDLRICASRKHIWRRPVVAALSIAVSIVGASIGSVDAASLWEHLFGKGKEQVAGSTTEASLAEKSTAPMAPGPPVSVAVPRVQRIAEYIEITGNAASVKAVRLVARVEGYLEEIDFQDGQEVHKGDLLFKIQQDQYKYQLEKAEAQVRSLQAAIKFGRTESSRYSGLLSSGGSSAVRVDEWNYNVAKSEAELASAQAQVELAKLNVGYTEVRAPFDGRMGKHLVDVGNLVGSAAQHTVLGEIVQLDPIYVVLNLSEQEVLQIRRNLNVQHVKYADLHKIPIEVGLAGASDYPFQGNIEYVAPAVDPQTGTLLVRGILPNAGHALIPGFFVRVRLPRGRVLPDALLVPDRAIQTDQGGRYLCIVGQDDVVEQRYTQLGELTGSMRVIASGITAKDRVIVSDFWRVSPGAKVTPNLVTLDEAGRGRADNGQ
jgi:RND family efflux transporter MFP subunit